MPKTTPLTIDLLTETSWEVCNKIGGIYTVLATKAPELTSMFGRRIVFIGPDRGSDADASGEYSPLGANSTLQRACRVLTLPYGIKARAVEWLIPGKPQAILVDFSGVYPHINEIYARAWERFGVDSLHAYGDYSEGCAFGTAAAYVTSGLAKAVGADPCRTIAHFDEWTTAMGLLTLRDIMPAAASVFTTHATSIGRSICGNGKPLYDYFSGYHGDQMASELNMEAKHSLEKTAAHTADCFTTVSDVTAAECRQLLDIDPGEVTPNGFDPAFVPTGADYRRLRTESRRRLCRVASDAYGIEFNPQDTFIIGTSGRNEYRNKGLDMFVDSIERMASGYEGARKVLACIFVPGWVREVNTGSGAPFTTHRLNNEDSDPLYRRVAEAASRLGGNVRILLMPCYLDGHDGVLDLKYYDMLPGLDATAFASYYEPWGYTPLESVAFHVPTVTTDKAGFGRWALGEGRGTLATGGVEVVERNDSDYSEACARISDTLSALVAMEPTGIRGIRRKAADTARLAIWAEFIGHYTEAYRKALANRTARFPECSAQ